MNNPCPIAVPCGDYPFENLSSEGPEPFWLPPRSQYWTAIGYCSDTTLKQSFSTVSQTDADNLLTGMLGTQCAGSDDAQSFCADVTCPTGTILNTICVPTSQSDANSIAATLATEMQPLCQQFFASAACPDGTSLGRYMSTSSQAEADAIAANFEAALLPFCGGTLYYADANCANGTFLGTYCSPVSQADADALAAAAVTAFSDLCGMFSSSCACPDGVTNPRTVYNPDSQAAADAQCAAIPKLCGSEVPGGDGTAPINTNGSVANEIQCCVVHCPDGSHFAYCIAAGTVYAPTLLQANSLAYALACNRAAANRTCMGNLSVTSCCQGVDTTSYVSVTGQGTFSWVTTAGGIPTGMHLGLINSKTAVLYGVPTTVGNYAFTLRATNENGNFMEKNFTFRVLSCAAVPFAYYKLDESVPLALLHDEVSAFDLGIGGGLFAPISVAGKIGTAIQGGGSVRNWYGPDSAHWVMPSFTVRFWFKSLFYPGSNYRIAAGLTWEARRIAGGSNYVRFSVDTTGGTVLVNCPALGYGVWNRIIVWFENGVGLGIKVNDDAPTLVATADPIAYAATDMLLLYVDPANDALDEVAVWNRKLTTTEMTADWNAGAGKTYPY